MFVSLLRNGGYTGAARLPLPSSSALLKSFQGTVMVLFRIIIHCLPQKVYEEQLNYFISLLVAFS